MMIFSLANVCRSLKNVPTSGISRRLLTTVPVSSKTPAENYDSVSEFHLKQVLSSMYLVPDFISKTEEQSLLDEVEQVFKTRRIRYEQSHWDDAIHNYRETEHLNWSAANQVIIERVRKIAFAQNVNHIKYVHILDITEDGFIKPHIDSVRFCGDTIAGISLLSDSVMRLRLDADRDGTFVDILLNRRSLYIMTGDARYKYAHEILDRENSLFKNQPIKRDRRISIICRNEPPSSSSSEASS